MKIRLNKFSFILLSLMLLFGACDDNESLIITSPEAEFTLNTPSITGIYLNFALPDNPAFTINWDDEVTGASSYTVEMATDTDFTSPITLGNTDQKSFSMTVSDFNDKLKEAGINSYENTGVYFRVKANNVNSNSILMLVTTYAVDPPVITAPDEAFNITLSDVDPVATALTVSWEDPEVGENSNATINYEVQIAPAGTDFSTLYSLGVTRDLSLTISHESLNDMILAMGGVAEQAADYNIRIMSTVETDSGDLIRTSEVVTISATPYETILPPILYVVGAGAADAGWNWNNPIELKLQGKVYSGNIRLTPDGGGNFRFFTDSSLEWASPSYNYPYYEVRGYTIDPNLVNANDGDSNFQFIGTEGEYSIKIDTQNRTITLGPPITSVYQLSTWGIVGDAANNWSSNGEADIPFYTSNQSNVFVAYATLLDGNIKFRENNDWGNNFGDNENDGTLESGGSDIPVTAGTYKITLNLNDNTYTKELYSWGIVGSVWNNWGNPVDGVVTPDAQFHYDYTTDTFKVGVKLATGAMKFRFNNDWGLNYGGSGGTLVEGGSDIAVSEGFYMVTIDINNLTYDISPANLFGIVGSGYNNWGNPDGDGKVIPDFILTQVQPDVWIAEGVELLDGAIKFRINEDWGTNYGGSDGNLVEGGSDITVTVGTYRITLDFRSSPTYTLVKLK